MSAASNDPREYLGQLLINFGHIGEEDLAKAFRTQQAKYFAFFLQDDVRPRSNLTLNLGIRFEGDRGTTERFNRTVAGFDPTAVNPVTQAAEAAYKANPVNGGVAASAFSAKGGLLFAGQNGVGSDVYKPNFGYFSPRFGLAWTPGGKGTVIRTGVGVFVASLGTNGINQPGFRLSFQIQNTS